MPKVFISYRRSDTQMVAGRLRESLAKHIGSDAIFRDKDSIVAGEDWTKAIKESLSGDVIVLALIGPSWETARDDEGRRRLDDPADWNRVELELALRGSNRIIPMLVDGAKMPLETTLPGSLQLLARSNALKLRDDDWDTDVERLVRAIGLRTNPSKKLRYAAIVMTSIVIVGSIGGYWWWNSRDETADSSAQSTPGTGSSFRKDIHGKLRDDLEKALNLLNSAESADKAKAIQVVDENLARIQLTLESFPSDAYIHALAGYAAKNVFESSRGNNLLSAEQRQKYLAKARQHFTDALKLKPNDPSALNGMGNVSFYEGKFDAAIKYHESAIKEAGGSYSHAEHDLNLVKQVKSGKVKFTP